jgi:hypothetical protein
MNTEAKRSRSADQPKSNSKPAQVSVTFGAYPEEIERWKRAAQAEERALSWWIRKRLLELETQDGAKT